MNEIVNKFIELINIISDTENEIFDWNLLDDKESAEKERIKLRQTWEEFNQLKNKYPEEYTIFNLQNYVEVVNESDSFKWYETA